MRVVGVFGVFGEVSNGAFVVLEDCVVVSTTIVSSASSSVAIRRERRGVVSCDCEDFRGVGSLIGSLS